ncbi:MAG: UrcA family protein [Pseudomonadota bacterium]
MSKIPLTIAALTTMGLGVAAPVVAQEVPTRTIHRADLNLATEQGQRVLRQRIASATEAVCGSYAGAGAEEEARITRCRASVADQVARQTGTVTLARR